MPLILAADLDVSAPEYLAEGLIPRTGIGFVYGPRTVGKSLVIDVELALAIANGRPFFGHETIQGSVVVCYGEGLADAGIRQAARLSRQAAEDAELIAGIRAAQGDAAAERFAAAMLPYTDDNVFPFVGRPFVVHTVNTEGDPTQSLVAAVTQMKRVKNLELVIIDTLSRFTGGLSISNDASASRAVLGLLYMARELNCCIMVVAHPTEDGKKMLGAGQLNNAADFTIAIRPEVGGQPGAPAMATITCEKAKQGPKFDPITYMIEPQILHVPALDANRREIPGETEPVPTATVRMSEAAGELSLPSASTSRPARQLPRIEAAPQPVKRSGLRQRAASYATTPAAPATLEPAPVSPVSPDMNAILDESLRAMLIAGLQAVPCPECSAQPGHDCDMAVAREMIMLGTGSPPLVVHTARADDAIAAGIIARDVLMEQFPQGSDLPSLAGTS